LRVGAVRIELSFGSHLNFPFRKNKRTGAKASPFGGLVCETYCRFHTSIRFLDCKMKKY